MKLIGSHLQHRLNHSIDIFSRQLQELVRRVIIKVIPTLRIKERASNQDSHAAEVGFRQFLLCILDACIKVCLRDRPLLAGSLFKSSEDLGLGCGEAAHAQPLVGGLGGDRWRESLCDGSANEVKSRRREEDVLLGREDGHGGFREVASEEANFEAPVCETGQFNANERASFSYMVIQNGTHTNQRRNLCK